MRETTSSILGPDGKPMKRAALTQEHAAPTTGGVRNVWRENVAKGLDPAKLARILKSADEGDHEQLLILAEEMEERDPHYSSVLGQRKRAISLITPIITGLADGGDDEIVKAAEKLVEVPIFSDMIDDCLDGIAKPYSCVDMIWYQGADYWAPIKYIYRDPRFFKFDKETGQEIRIKDDAYPDGKPIPPYSMIIHRPKTKSGLTLRSGLARICCWAFMLKSFTMQDWAAFIEIFGMPLRVGKYDGNAGPEEKRTLLRAVRDLGSDAAAIIPIGMEIEFITTEGGKGEAVFGAMVEYLDKQISKAVLGQTMTTDEGSSFSQAKVHADVKIDIQKSDARQMASTINRDLIAPFVAFNFGANAPVPVLSFPVDDPADIETMSKALERLIPVGLKVSMSDVRKKIGFAKPGEKDEILVPLAPAAEPKPDETKKDDPPKKPVKKPETARACLNCGETHLAAEGSPEPTITDMLAQEGMDEWEADLGPLIAQILAAAENSNDYETFLQRLDTIDPATQKLARTMAIQAMKARGDGDLGNA